MLVSYRWLNDWVDLSKETPSSLAEKLTLAGVEVESINNSGMMIENVVVGKVVGCIQHPNADRLRVCSVDVGKDKVLQIVCGAANVGVGQYVIVALCGAILPGNFKIKKSKLRGEVSEGMICSLSELGISENNLPKKQVDGIFNFSEEMELGISALEALFLNDTILELGLTPNRADCLNIYGVANEVAAILGKQLKRELPEIVVNKYNKLPIGVNVKVETNKTSYYCATIIENVTIAPSPQWMQTQLMLAGIRPHNNVVDIGNYVMFELGQPLHMFDYDKLMSEEIVVRTATKGEKIITLDEVERTLVGDEILITNGNDPVAIAGVSGGLSSAITEATNKVLLEVAYFDSFSIRQTSKHLGLRSESSARYEKGIDPKRLEVAHSRAIQLLCEYAGGSIKHAVQYVNNRNLKPTVISITPRKINQVLGIELDTETIMSILNNLQFNYELENNNFIINVPSRRQDIQIPEDIIEEIARLYGYDNIPNKVSSIQTEKFGLTSYQSKRRQTSYYFTGIGLNEVLTYSLTSETKAKIENIYSSKKYATKLESPLSEERSYLRTSLIPNLLDTVQFNRARQIEDISLFEIGNVYINKDSNEELTEYENVAGVVSGAWHVHEWQGEKKNCDFFVIKGIVESFLKKFASNYNFTFKKTETDLFHPGRCALIIDDNNKTIGVCGQIIPEIANNISNNEIYAFELSLSTLLDLKKEQLISLDPPKFPAVTRDIALVVDQNIVAMDVQKEIETAGGKLLQVVHLFDIYQGENIDKGKKSLAFSLKFIDETQTLTDEIVQKNYDNILEKVNNKFGGTLRC